VRENLEAMRRLHPGTGPQAVGRAIEWLGLAEYADRRAGTLSHGNKQRLGLAKALLHTPQILISTSPPTAWTRPGL
jgi:ABC-2 type transport system ATP-binding protein